MSERNATGKGLDRPHKAVAAVKGVGSGYRNARSIGSSEKTEAKKNIGQGGLAHSYFKNSRSAVHPNFDKHPHD